ncbi:hypothetical protein ACA910_011358 [Epithemia clementina (nom. ined.)]
MMMVYKSPRFAAAAALSWSTFSPSSSTTTAVAAAAFTTSNNLPMFSSRPSTMTTILALDWTGAFRLPFSSSSSSSSMVLHNPNNYCGRRPHGRIMPFHRTTSPVTRRWLSASSGSDDGKTTAPATATTKATNQETAIGEATTATEWMDTLPLEKGSHNSSIIRIPSLHGNNKNGPDPFDRSLFRQRLQATIQACRAQGNSSLWIHVPMERSSLLEDACAIADFTFHHATNRTAVLNLWLPDAESNKVPEYATHHVGVGALVLNRRGTHILCVREQRNNYRPWKTPTGLTELGEALDEAAEREVWEETGIRTKFHSVLGFRQTHGVMHGRSDLFVMCRCDLVLDDDDNDDNTNNNGDIGDDIFPQPIPQQGEIETAQWIPLTEFRAMVFDQEHGHPMMQYFFNAMDEGLCLDKVVVDSVVPGRKSNTVYYPTRRIMNEEQR